MFLRAADLELLLSAVLLIWLPVLVCPGGRPFWLRRTFLWLKLATFLYLHTYWLRWSSRVFFVFIFLPLGLFMYLDLCLIIKDEKKTSPYQLLRKSNMFTYIINQLESIVYITTNKSINCLNFRLKFIYVMEFNLGLM